MNNGQLRDDCCVESYFERRRRLSRRSFSVCSGEGVTWEFTRMKEDWKKTAVMEEDEAAA